MVSLCSTHFTGIPPLTKALPDASAGAPVTYGKAEKVNFGSLVGTDRTYKCSCKLHKGIILKATNVSKLHQTK